MLTPLTSSRILHLVTVPPKRSTNEHVMPTRRLSPRRGRHLPGNRPDEPRELARNRGGDLWFGLPSRDQTPDARRQPELRVPRDVADDLRQRFLPVRMLASDPRNPLIGPRGFREQASHMRIAGLRDAAASDTRPTGIFRGYEPEIRHELARMTDAREVAEFRDEGDRRDEGHPAQRLPRGDDRRPAPRRRELTPLLREPGDTRLGFVDRVSIFLERDVLRRIRETEI